MSTLQMTPERARRLLTRGNIWLLVAVLLFLVAYPIFKLVVRAVTDTDGAFTSDHLSSLLTRSTLTAALNSVILAFCATAVALAFGCVLAWLAARTDVPGKWAVLMAGIVPMILPSLVGGFAWTFLANPSRGFINMAFQWANLPFTVNIYSLPGMIFVLGLYSAPYSFLMVYSALTLMNPELEEAASVHGGRQINVLTFVTAPLVKTAISTSGLLTFALTIENFPVPALLGIPGKVDTMPTLIYRVMQTPPPQVGAAAAIGILLTIALIATVTVQRRVLGRSDNATVSGKGHQPRIIKLGRLRWPAFLVALLYITLTILLPVFALVQMVFRRQPFIADFGDYFDVGQFALTHLQAVLVDEAFLLGLKNAVVVSAFTAGVGIVFYTIVSFAAQRSTSRARGIVLALAMAPVALPPIVLSVGFLLAWIDSPLPLYGSLAILVLAYVVRIMPTGFGSIFSSLGQVHRDLEDAAVMCGSSRWRAALEITMPIIRSSTVAALIMIVILSFRELSIALFLFTSKTRILSIVIINYTEDGRNAAAAGASLVYCAALAVLVFFTRRWLSVARVGE